MIRTRTLAALLLLLVAVPGSAGAEASRQGAAPASAQNAPGPGGQASPDVRDPGLEARASRVASELRCPVCQGLSIEDSPSPLALEMKQLIRDQLAAGWSEEEVKRYFTSRYGEWVLLEPRASGFNLLVYLLPLVALLLGVGIVVVAVRRWTRPVG